VKTKGVIIKFISLFLADNFLNDTFSA